MVGSKIHLRNVGAIKGVHLSTLREVVRLTINIFVNLTALLVDMLFKSNCLTTLPATQIAFDKRFDTRLVNFCFDQPLRNWVLLYFPKSFTELILKPRPT